jgi:cyclophilin family peptidyl-prolyl cis-trans isomerase/HEAT repeat protein
MRRRWALTLSALSLLAGLACAASAIAQQNRPAVDPIAAILAIEDDRASTAGDLDALVAATHGNLSDFAIRALGRLQRRDVIPRLLPFLSTRRSKAEAATALALAVRGRPGDAAFPLDQQRAVLDALIAAGDAELSQPKPVGLPEIARAVGRLPYQHAEGFEAAETFLRRVLVKPSPKGDGARAYAARGLESLARLGRKIGTLSDATVDALEAEARMSAPGHEDTRRNALAALIAAQRVDTTTLNAVLRASDLEVRRLAMLSVGGAGSPITDNEVRLGYIRQLLADPSPMVRYEALRAWIRRGVAPGDNEGCQPLLEALRDRSLHVALAAIDALGDACREDDSITTTITSEARTPASLGRWHREAHALVALAKRDRARASISLLSFASHRTWQVRMYAARAAAILGDADVLARLAADADDNVAEAALPELRRLRGADSDAAFIAALKRETRKGPKNTSLRPYQVIRAAALALEKAEPTRPLVEALAGALQRLSAEQCETSRDARLALIARLGELGRPPQADVLEPLLTDIDPAVGQAAAALLTEWSGRPVRADTPPARSGNIPTSRQLGSRSRVVIEMENGGRIEIAPSLVAPVTRHRFLSAVRAGYYDNLTFHRVVPNFVIQGGSPNANEYCGDCPFMRDELGGMHTRGTLGISTRGRDTGDAQIFINLIDNARLDYDYTVCGAVCSGMDVVDGIQEGDRILRVQEQPATPRCGG